MNLFLPTCDRLSPLEVTTIKAGPLSELLQTRNFCFCRYKNGWVAIDCCIRFWHRITMNHPSNSSASSQQHLANKPIAIDTCFWDRPASKRIAICLCVCYFFVFRSGFLAFVAFLAFVTFVFSASQLLVCLACVFFGFLFSLLFWSLGSKLKLLLQLLRVWGFGGFCTCCGFCCFSHPRKYIPE